MKRFFVLAILFVIAGKVFAQEPLSVKPTTAGKKPTAEYLLNSSSQGRDFWVAIPPNDQILTTPRAVEIYVTSNKNTKVTLEVPGRGFKTTKSVDSMKITTFSSADNTMNWEYELLANSESGRVSDKAIHLYADQPFSVYVMNAKLVSSDGYLGLPTSVLGTEYIHVGYYDFGEFIQDGKGWGGGFIVIATEDNTQVGITYAGRGTGRTRGDAKKIGDNTVVTLKKGQTYMVTGDGTTRGSFDLTGTKVTSSRPVSFISFHMRCMIPSAGVTDGRDHMCEMLLPISAWGKKYITVEYQRENRGDFFRIVASQPKTTFTVKYYDKATGVFIGQRGGLLKNPGDFMEYEETDPTGDPTHQSIKGVSIWEADKPVFVMQYAYSANWDLSPIFDPFMIWVVPVEQYTKGTVFQTPSNAAYINNYFNILAVGDPNDPNQTLLKTVEIDGKPIWKSSPKFLIQRIPTTNIYWATIKVNPDAHRIKGETPFGAYIYGFSEFESYGWPAATAVNKIDQLDTLAPELTKTMLCGNYEVEATELRDGAAEDTLRQVDQGVRDVELVEGKNYNYRLKLVTMDPIIPDPKIDRFKFKLEVIDRRKNAFAVFAVTDRAGNTAFDSVTYFADVAVMNPDSLVFGNVRLGRTKQLTAILSNPSDSVLTIKSLRLMNNREFKILDGAAPPEYQLQPKATKTLKFEYTPIRESLVETDFDVDTVLAESRCGEFVLGSLRGRGVLPHIRVSDFDAGIVSINVVKCKDVNDVEGIKIQNIGTDTLTITAIKGVVKPFTLSNPTQPPLPIVIPPGGEVQLKMICFEPTVSGSTRLDITFVCDTLSGDDDNISEWKGIGIKDEPMITNYDWKERRVKTINSQGILKVFNYGDASVNLTSLLMPTNPNFELIRTVPDFSGGEINIAGKAKDSLVIYVRYIPQTEATHVDSVTVNYRTAGNVAGQLRGEVRGIGILPKIQPTGYNFKKVLKGTVSTEAGFVTITNPSLTADLYVWEVRFANMVPAGAFAWSIGAITKNFTVKRNGESVKIPVTFTGVELADRADVEIICDAGPGPTEKDSIVMKTVEVLGSAYEILPTDIQANGFAFPATLYCNTALGEISVINPNNEDISVTDLVIENGEAAVFSFAPSKPSVPFTIPKKETKKIGIKLDPQLLGVRPNTTKNYTANVRIANSVRDTSVTLTASSYIVSATFKLADMTGKKLLPGETVMMPMTVESTNYADANITEFTATIMYNASDIRLENVISLLSGWTITKDDSTPGQIKLTAKGTSAISNANPVCNLEFKAYLSLANTFPVSFGGVPVTKRETCVDISKVDGMVYPAEYCARNMKGLGTTSGFDYALGQNVPNPAGTTTEIEYSVGLSGNIRLVLFNAMGEEVKTLTSGYREAGVYRLTVPTADLGGGIYYYRLLAGPYSATQKMIIAK